MEQTQLQTFTHARNLLAERRSALIKAVARSTQLEQIEAHIGLIVRIQNAMDVVDKAISDEQRAAAPAS
jgi:hypothetical protein